MMIIIRRKEKNSGITGKVKNIVSRQFPNGGRRVRNMRDFTKLFTRATTKNMNKRKISLEKRIRNIYNKITNQN